MGKEKFKVFSDMPGWEAAGGGTIPADLCIGHQPQTGQITAQIHETRHKEIDIFEQPQLPGLVWKLQKLVDKR